jgi:signal transduction histidine kinase
MTDNSRKVEGGHVEALNASRKRLLMAADAARRKIERDLHAGVQQHLVALAVNLQLAGALADSDPAAAKALLEEMGRDVQHALDETAQLAQRIYPQLDAVGFAAALRSAAVSAGVRTSVETDVDTRFPPELLATAYWSWLEVLDHTNPGAYTTITVREKDGTLAFEITAEGDHSAVLGHLSDRVDALGGALAIQSEPERGTRVWGSLPLGE